MKILINRIFNAVGITSYRTKNITKHIAYSLFYKSGSMIANFLLVPVTISYLNTENYGIWLTLTSFISWFSFFDIGLGNGLRNKFAEAKSKGDLKLARAYISSAYFTLGSFSLFLMVAFIAINFFIDWTVVFNSNLYLQKELSILMPVVFAFFCLQLVLKLITTIYTADQHHSMQGKINFYIQIVSLLAIWLMTKTTGNSLLIFGSIFSALPVIILLWFNFFSFSNTYKEFKPKLSLWKKEYLKTIFELGFMFFIVQLSGIILFSTDNLIITQLYGPEEVVPYNIAFKYLSISNMVLSIILTPYWSTITEAYIKGDFDWIKQSMNNLIKISAGSIFLLIIMVSVSSFAYKIWVGDNIHIPFTLTLFMAIFFGLTNFYSPFTYFINGTGKVKLQLISLIATSVINIPLAIFLASNIGLGVSGVIIATIICLIPHTIICPIQYSKIINKKAYGIWNK